MVCGDDAYRRSMPGYAESHGQMTVKGSGGEVAGLGFSRRRTGRGDGKPRYTAYYVDIKGRERSAGTFSNRKEADKAWQRAETKLAEGRVGDPARGRMTFQRYVEETWCPTIRWSRPRGRATRT